MKEPEYKDKEKCLDIRRRSKSGERISQEELDFCVKMLKKFPKWYSSTSKEVFNDTVPFGSNKKLE